MRRRPFLVLAVVVAAYFIADGLAWHYTLADFTGRPITLVNGSGAEARRVPVWQPRTPAATPPHGAALNSANSGIPFGMEHRFTLPSGETVACDHVLEWMWCQDGWAVEREG